MLKILADRPLTKASLLENVLDVAYFLKGQGHEIFYFIFVFINHLPPIPWSLFIPTFIEHLVKKRRLLSDCTYSISISKKLKNFSLNIFPFIIGGKNTGGAPWIANIFPKIWGPGVGWFLKNPQEKISWHYTFNDIIVF
jgi:hypothetical protein